MSVANRTGRNSNIELLRFISMLMIVAYHYAIMGFYAEDIMYTSNKSFVDIFGMGGKIGTDVFVLISGYYMVKSRFTLKKLLVFMGQIWFYTIGALLIFTVIKGPGALSVQQVKSAFFPLITSHYWFATYYVLLMLLSPFLNRMLCSLDKKEHGLLAVFLFCLTTVMPEIFGLTFAGGSLWLFVALYVSAAWCRLYIEGRVRLANLSLVAAFGVILLCALKICFSNSVAQRVGDSLALQDSVAFMGAYSPYAFVIALLMLIGFCGREQKQNNFWFRLGGFSFGVYLLHANQIVNEFIYQGLFHTAEHAASPWLFVHALVVVAAIYAAGCLTEYIRKKVFAPLWDRIVEMILPILEKTVKKSSILRRGFY